MHRLVQALAEQLHSAEAELEHAVEGARGELVVALMPVGQAGGVLVGIERGAGVGVRAFPQAGQPGSLPAPLGSCRVALANMSLSSRSVADRACRYVCPRRQGAG